LSARNLARGRLLRSRVRAFARFGDTHVGSAVAIDSRGARPEGAAAAATARILSARNLARGRLLRSRVRAFARFGDTHVGSAVAIDSRGAP